MTEEEKQELNNQIALKANEIRNLTAEQTNKNNEIAQLRQQIQNLTTGMTNLTYEKNILNNNLTERKTLIQQLQDSEQQLREKCKALTADIQVLTNEKNTQTSNSTTLAKVRDTLINEKRILNNKFNRLNTNHEELQIIKNNLATAVEQKDATINQLQVEINLANRNLSEYKKEKEILFKQFTSMNNKIKKLKDYKSKVRVQLEENLVDSQQQDQIITTLTENRQSEREKYLQDQNNLNAQIQDLSQEYDLLQRKFKKYVGDENDIIYHKDFEEQQYDFQINMRNLFDEKSLKIENFQKITEFESTKDLSKIVSLYGQAKGKTFIFDNLVEKQFKLQEGMDIGIYKYEVNEEVDVQFIDTKSKNQPIQLFLKNKKERIARSRTERSTVVSYFEDYKKYDVIESFKEDLLIDISDILIVVVNQITKTEQDLIIKLKNSFQMKENKIIIIVHNLYTLTLEEVEQQSLKIQTYFSLDKMTEGNNFYLLDKTSKIKHFILGNAMDPKCKQQFFKYPLNKIKQFIEVDPYYDSIQLSEGIQHFLNTQYNNYVEVDILENQEQSDCQISLNSSQTQGIVSNSAKKLGNITQYNNNANDCIEWVNTTEGNSQQKQSDITNNQQQQQQQQYQQYIKDDQAQEELIKDSKPNIPSSKEKSFHQYAIHNVSEEYASSSELLCETPQAYFIAKDSNLELNKEKYKFAGAKKQIFYLKEGQVNSIKYDIESIQGGTCLNIYLEIPGNLNNLSSFFDSTEKKLIIRGYKEQDYTKEYLKESERSFGKIIIELERKEFQFYECTNFKYLKNGVYKIILVRKKNTQYLKIESQ